MDDVGRRGKQPGKDLSHITCLIHSRSYLVPFVRWSVTHSLPPGHLTSRTERNGNETSETDREADEGRRAAHVPFTPWLVASSLRSAPPSSGPPSGRTPPADDGKEGVRGRHSSVPPPSYTPRPSFTQLRLAHSDVSCRRRVGREKRVM